MVRRSQTVLTEADRAAVSDAIARAERATSGEIFCVLCRQSDDYFHAAGFTLALAVLVSGVLFAWAAHAWWLAIDPRYFALALVGAFLLGLAILGLVPPLRMRFVAKRLRYRRAHAQAMSQFSAHGLSATRERTGVLVFLSLAERYGAVIADAAIDAKVSQDDWNATVAALIEGARQGAVGAGFVAAVEKAGGLLAEHFPRRDDDTNELPDRIVEM